MRLDPVNADLLGEAGCDKKVEPIVASFIRAAEKVELASRGTRGADEVPAGSDQQDLNDLLEPPCLSAADLDIFQRACDPQQVDETAEEIPFPTSFPPTYRLDISDEEIDDAQILAATI